MMALKAIDQQIFDWIYTVADGLGFDVYDFLPQYEVAYPFVVIGEVQVVPRQVKHRTLGLFMFGLIYGLSRKADGRSQI
ncbi:Uncharacterised protein [Alloiococcus otitis]|uniref:hypothetical protein n=1 Tax=Alloiococcus otitis TaxID=1652 RepID=UPI000E1539D9|nr:hypothetical protein [Alloiococcus otitis]SUU91728.1 Uncharacterised protein [Alloiococcus otitis]